MCKGLVPDVSYSTIWFGLNITMRVWTRHRDTGSLAEVRSGLLFSYVPWMVLVVCRLGIR